MNFHSLLKIVSAGVERAPPASVHLHHPVVPVAI